MFKARGQRYRVSATGNGEVGVGSPYPLLAIALDLCFVFDCCVSIYVYMCTACMPSDREDSEKCVGSLELELRVLGTKPSPQEQYRFLMVESLHILMKNT